MNALTELRITREAGEDAHAYAVHVERLEAQLAAERRRTERLSGELDHANVTLASMESVMEDATLYIQLLRRRVADLEAHVELGAGLCNLCGGGGAGHSHTFTGGRAGAGRWGGGAGAGAYGTGSWGEPAEGQWRGGAGAEGGGGGGSEASSSGTDPFSMPAIRKQIQAAVADTEAMPEPQRKQRVAALRLR